MIRLEEFKDYKKLLEATITNKAFRSRMMFEGIEDRDFARRILKYISALNKGISSDELDNIFNGFVRERDTRSIWELLWRADEVDLKIGEQLDELLPDENQVNIGIAYLAGKALGVDLVKVVER